MKHNKIVSIVLINTFSLTEETTIQPNSATYNQNTHTSRYTERYTLTYTHTHKTLFCDEVLAGFKLPQCMFIFLYIPKVTKNSYYRCSVGACWTEMNWLRNFTELISGFWWPLCFPLTVSLFSLIIRFKMFLHFRDPY